MNEKLFDRHYMVNYDENKIPFIDLDHVMIVPNSISLCPVGGPRQVEGLDYKLVKTNGKIRIKFLNELKEMLRIGDLVYVQYRIYEEDNNLLELTAKNITDMYVSWDHPLDWTKLEPLKDYDIVKVNMSKEAILDGIEKEIASYETELKRLYKLKEEVELKNEI